MNDRKGRIKVHVLFIITPLILTAMLSVFAEAQKDEKRIKVLNNRLSVDLRDAEFGGVMKEIGDMAGFEVKISTAISNKTLSTSFSNMEMQRGINRLLTLISQKNYFIYYAPDNSISRIEVFVPGKGPGKRSASEWRPSTEPVPEPSTGPGRPTYSLPQKSPEPVPFRGRPRMPRNRRSSEKPVVEKPTMEKSAKEEPEQKKVPYIPPSQVPAYIPPAEDKPK